MSTADQIATGITTIALVLVLFGDLVFIGIMHAVIPWRTNAWGRHVMFFSYALAMPMIFGLARLVFGDYPYRLQILAFWYVILALAMSQRVFMTLREHIRSQHPAPRPAERFDSTVPAPFTREE